MRKPYPAIDKLLCNIFGTSWRMSVGFMDLIIIVIVIVTLGAVAVFVLQCLFWLSLIFGGGGSEPERDAKQEAYETYMKMKRDEFYLNNGYQENKKP